MSQLRRGRRARLGCATLEDRAVPAAFAVADLNDDDRADLVVAETPADRIAVYLNGPGGALGAPGYYPTGPGSRPTDVFVVDADGDGQPDIAAFNTGSGPGVHAINLLGNVGNRDGFTGFIEADRGFLVASPALSFARGDFDGDGLTDEVQPGGAVVWGNGTGPVPQTPAAGPQGPPGPQGQAVQSFFNAFSNTPQVVGVGGDFTFEGLGTTLGSDVTFTPGTGAFVLNAAGTYRVDFTVTPNVVAGTGPDVAVTRNGTPVLPTFGTITTVPLSGGTVGVVANAGDVLTIRNIGPVGPLTIGGGGRANPVAEITITRLS